MNQYGYCKRCGRRLKDDISKERGYGKVCFIKMQQRTSHRLIELKKENNNGTAQDRS